MPFCSHCSPNPHGSTLIWLSWIRIRIGNVNLDPGAWKLKSWIRICNGNQCGSTTPVLALIISFYAVLQIFQQHARTTESRLQVSTGINFFSLTLYIKPRITVLKSVEVLAGLWI
jgi:hypothetical protein